LGIGSVPLNLNESLSTFALCCEQREQRITTTETVVIGKPYVTTSTQLDRMAMTAKGKKMASWVLSSRHHSSHPQLPSTRPKKSMGDRG
jgi:hypothetical protein